MTILLITHYGSLYGANKSLINLIDGLLLKKDVKIILVAPNGAITDEMKLRDVEIWSARLLNEVHPVGASFPIIKGILKFLHNWFIAAGLFLKVRRRRVDLIHTNSSVSFLGAYVAYLSSIPHVWHIREYGFKDYNIQYSFGLKYFNFWIRRAASVISISRSLAESRLNELKINNLQIINNGVILKADIISYRQQAVISDKIVFGIVGLIAKEKGQMDALKAFSICYKENKNISLYIIGGVSNEIYMSELKTFVTQHGLEDAVAFTGFQQDIDQYYRKMNVLLMCSKNEALGRVTIEAMAKGIVVIGYNNAGTSEIIQEDVTGLFYNSDYVELADKMNRLLKDAQLMSDLSKNGIDEVKKKYSIEIYSDNIYRLYQDILEN